MEPAEMAQLVTEGHRAWLALGEVSYGASAADESSLTFRRSLYVVRDMKAGDEFTCENLRAIRPSLGLAPKHIGEVLGRIAGCDIARGTPLVWSLLVGVQSK